MSVSPATASISDTRNEYFVTEHLQADLGRRTARGGAVTVASHSLRFVITIAATSVMARLLRPSDYGLIGMVAFFTNFVAMFKDLGLSIATIQKSEIDYKQVSTLFWLNVAFSFLITMLTIVLAPAISWFYGEPRLVAVTAVSAVGFLFGGLTVQHEALLRRQMRFLSLAVIALASMLSGYVVGIYLAWRGWSYWALVFSQLALLLVNAVGVWTICRWRPGLPARNSGVRSMVAFGRNFTGFSIINYFSRNLDNLLLGRFWGANELGLYNRAYQLMTLPIDQINEPVTSVAIPALSRINDEDERYRQAYRRMLEKIAMFTMPAVAFLMATSDWIVQIVLGPQWSATSRIFLLLGITGLFQPIANTTGWLFLTQGRSRDMFHWGLISGPITMASIVIGLPWGAVGIASSYALTRVALTDPLLFWFVGRKGPVRTRDFYHIIAPFTFAALASLGISAVVRSQFQIHNPILGLIALFIVTGVVTLASLAVLPSGRLALLDIKKTFSLMTKARSEVALAR
ncbi:MAG TPA: lipopolysaccharide biosynthesis protein [Pyrinomonadaceae bacterium]|nr:lipopolysaccharide biosynthesis protein [Pyrinomonadaceae bacterium]